ncbi:MAG: cytochrome c [Acidobacteriota bacterium]
MKKKTLTCAVLLALALPVAAFADGAAIYKAKCAACHGADGSGQTTIGKNLKLKDLGTPEVQNLTNVEMTKILAEGKGKMKPSKLSAQDMEAVIAFVRSLKK